MDTTILASLFSKIILIFIIGGVFLLSKRIRVVYEVLLVLAGILLALGLHFFAPMQVAILRLDPELLLFGFLPMLLLQIAHTMPYKDIIRNIRPIGILAIVSPIISSLAIGFLLKFGIGILGYDIPLLIALLFGTIMSSTDPVTVLSIFHKLGVPNRLVLLFEGESLFNDGASLALFFLVLSWIVGTTAHTTMFDGAILSVFGQNIVIESILTFTSMILGGMVAGIVSGICFSKLLLVFKQHQYLSLLVIIASAYAAYLVTELVNSHLFPASAIIATIISSFIVGNYGRYKIDLKTEELAQSVFEFIAFLINSTIFILVGASILQLDTSLLSVWFWILPTTVLCVILGRAVSIYFPIGIMNLREKPTEKIPNSWQHIIAWGGLRGGLALALVELIPFSLVFPIGTTIIPVRDFLLTLVITAVFFSIFVKTLSLEWLVKKLRINALSPVEQIEEEEAKLITITSMLSNIDRLHEQKYLSDREHDYLTGIYTKRYTQILHGCKILVEQATAPHSAFLKIASLYALALERHFAKELYAHGDITEKPLKRFLAIIDRQTHRLRSGRTQIREIFQDSYRNDFFEWMESSVARFVNPDANPEFTEYAVLRSRVLILEQTIDSLEDLRELAIAL